MKTDINWDRVILGAVIVLCLVMGLAIKELIHETRRTLLALELKEAPSQENEWGEHEVQFLEVTTSKGEFTMASHNEHNGYYGGFAIELRFIATPTTN